MDLSEHRLILRKNMPRAYEFELKESGKDRLVKTLAVILLKRYAVSKKKHYDLLSQYIDLIAETQDYSPIFDVKSMELPLCWNTPPNWKYDYIRYEWGHLHSKSGDPDLEYDLENFGLYSARCNQHMQSSLNIEDVSVYGPLIEQRISDVLLKREALFKKKIWKDLKSEFNKLKR